MKTVHLPAEQWVKMTAINSCHRAVETKAGKLVSVHAAEHEGHLYTAFGTVHGPYGGRISPRIEAYKLVPLALFGGTTTRIYHDEEAIEAGLRRRGDHTGLIVSVGGKSMVCAQEVMFVEELPSLKPLPLESAITFNDVSSKQGFRALSLRGCKPEWHSLRRHPVAAYYQAGERHAVLFWGEGMNDRGVSIHELWVDESVQLEPLSRSDTHLTGQLSLF